jgi:nucleoid-associated protein YgaU
VAEEDSMADFRSLDFSNTDKRSSSTALLDAPDDTEWTETDPDETDRMYVVREDDSLSSIARKFYGKASSRIRIIEANRRLIHDPYLIQPGWRLRIP